MLDLKPFLGVTRAPFLLLSVTLVALGAAAGAREGTFSPARTLVALVGLVALHLAVNTFNEVSDMRRGIDLATQRTPFSGGSGTLPSGTLGMRMAVLVGLGGATGGLACGLWLLSEVGPVLVPWMALGAFFVLAYSDVLSRLGLGEVAAGLGLGGLAVAGTALVQGGSAGPTAWAAAVPAFCLTFNLLLLNEFPDEVADREGGRKNLVLLLGRRRAAQVYGVVALCVPAAILAGVLTSALPAPTLVALLPCVFLLGPLRWVVGDANSPVPIPALGANVVWILATNGLLAAGLTASILI